jgi:hypothetical protein
MGHLAEETILLHLAVAKMVAHDAERTRGVSEVAGGPGRRQPFNKEGTQSLVLPVSRHFGVEEEAGFFGGFR